MDISGVISALFGAALVQVLILYLCFQETRICVGMPFSLIFCFAASIYILLFYVFTFIIYRLIYSCNDEVESMCFIPTLVGELDFKILISRALFSYSVHLLTLDSYLLNGSADTVGVTFHHVSSICIHLKSL